MKSSSLEVIVIPNTKKSNNSYINLLINSISTQIKVNSDYSFKSLLKSNVVHYNWLESNLSFCNTFRGILSICRTGLFLKMNAFFKCKNILTVHNVIPHDFVNQKLISIYKYIILNNIHGFVFLNQESVKEFIEYYKIKNKINYVVISHGHFKDLIPPELLDSPQNVDQNVLLFYGQIRPYKNIESLIDEFLLDNSKTFQLSIIGKLIYNRDYFLALTKISQLITNFNFISDSVLFESIAKSKAVVFPYKKILNSGSIFLALSLNKVVFVPENLKLFGLNSEIEKGYILYYKDYNDLKNQFSNLELNSKKFELELHNWNSISNILIKFYIKCQSL